jgi:predicted DNA-binding transcriptional regulator AlpA
MEGYMTAAPRTNPGAADMLDREGTMAAIPHTGHGATSPPDPDGFPDRLLTQKQVLEMTSLSRSSLLRFERAGTFPRPVVLGKARIAYRLSAEAA